MTDVILLCLPFVADLFPLLGISILKSVLNNNNIQTEIIYANLIFKNKIPDILYKNISTSKTSNMACELIFSESAFPSMKIKHNKLKHKYKKIQTGPNRYIGIDNILLIKKKVKFFIEEMIDIIINKNPKILGLNSSYNQICVCTAICNEIKKINPDIITVIGGFNAQKPMAKAILKISPSIDYAFSGEADFEFLSFCKNALVGDLPDSKVINCKPISNMDSLPYPDFTDFYKQKKDNNSSRLIFETSRGCWWAEKKHCIFCGGLGLQKNYRQKSPGRIRQELNFLLKKYREKTIYPTDNIFYKNFKDNFIINNSLKEFTGEIYYEIKSILTYDQLKDLRNNNLNLCQTGIETLNDELLDILCKGSSTLNNLRFMRDCKSLGIKIVWMFLYNIPGEKTEYYNQIKNLIPKILHLHPPLNYIPLQFQRFSPLFDNPSKYNIKKIKPLDIYYDIFPQNTDFFNIAIFFSADYDTVLNDENKKYKFFMILEKWKFMWKISNITLSLIKLSKKFFIIIDTRYYSDPNVGNNQQKYTLITKNHYLILKQLRVIRKKKYLIDYVMSNDLKSEFDFLFKNFYIIEINNNLLSIVCEYERSSQDYEDNEVEFSEKSIEFNRSKIINRLNKDKDYEKKFNQDPELALAEYSIVLSVKDLELLKRQMKLLN